jgi:hypothetical protein
MAKGAFRIPVIEATSGINYTVNAFTSSGTWTKPSGLSHIYALIIAGGGGGAGGTREAASTNRGGGGSSNGGVLLIRIAESDLDSTETIVVGAAGTGGPARTTTTGNGSFGTAGGASSFKGISINGGITAAFSNPPVSTFGTFTTNVMSSAFNRKSLLNIFHNSHMIGNITLNTADASQNQFRAFMVLSSIQNSFNKIESSASVGGGLNSSNVVINGGPLAGRVNHSTGSIIEESPGALVGQNGVIQTPSITLGQWLSRDFMWLDPADIPYNIARPGGGGGPSNAAGTVSAGNGAVGSGYGAAGGGGGGAVSVSGCHSGAGGNGTQGIVIVINVLS